MEKLWERRSQKTYITGAHGSRHRDEAFGDPYELPPDRAYGETCASIASFSGAGGCCSPPATAATRKRWSARSTTPSRRPRRSRAPVLLLQPAPPPQRPRRLERGLASERLPWFRAPAARRTSPGWSPRCTPTSPRATARAPAAPACPAGSERGARRPSPSCSSSRRPTRGTAASGSPSRAASEWTLSLRMPSWCGGARCRWTASRCRPRRTPRGTCACATHGTPPRASARAADGRRVLHPHPRIDAVRGCVALARGPVVYCIEQADHPGDVPVEDLRLDLGSPPAAAGPTPTSACRSRSSAPQPSRPGPADCTRRTALPRRRGRRR